MAPKCTAKCVFINNIYCMIVINVVIMPDNTPNMKHDLLITIIQFIPIIQMITNTRPENHHKQQKRLSVNIFWFKKKTTTKKKVDVKI